MADLPNDTQHVAIVGKNGSGKTQAGAYWLSRRHFERMPWIIFNFKGDDLLNEIGAKEVDLGMPPSKPGLYTVRPFPGQYDAMERYFWRIWKQENVGVYIDEGYMLDKNSEAWQALLTQGRSKHIPIITLSQRPVNVNRFIFSESSFHQIFWLNDRRDRQTVQQYVPADLERRLPQYHSWWYDVNSDVVNTMRPVPDRDVILQNFQDRLKPHRKFL